MPGMSIDGTDASELAELLRFLADWIDSDAGRLGASLLAFVGHPAYGTVQLQALERQGLVSAQHGHPSAGSCGPS